MSIFSHVGAMMAVHRRKNRTSPTADSSASAEIREQDPDHGKDDQPRHDKVEGSEPERGRDDVLKR